MTALSAWMKPHLSAITMNLGNKLKAEDIELNNLREEISKKEQLRRELQEAFRATEKLQINFAHTDGKTYKMTMTIPSSSYYTFEETDCAELYKQQQLISSRLEKQAGVIIQDLYAKACVKKLNDKEKDDIIQQVKDLL